MCPLGLYTPREPELLGGEEGQLLKLLNNALLLPFDPYS
jgi:hypothetical protein